MESTLVKILLLNWFQTRHGLWTRKQIIELILWQISGQSLVNDKFSMTLCIIMKSAHVGYSWTWQNFRPKNLSFWSQLSVSFCDSSRGMHLFLSFFLHLFFAFFAHRDEKFWSNGNQCCPSLVVAVRAACANVNVF